MSMCLSTELTHHVIASILNVKTENYWLPMNTTLPLVRVCGLSKKKKRGQVWHL